MGAQRVFNKAGFRGGLICCACNLFADVSVTSKSFSSAGTPLSIRTGQGLGVGSRISVVKQTLGSGSVSGSDADGEDGGDSSLGVSLARAKKMWWNTQYVSLSIVRKTLSSKPEMEGIWNGGSMWLSHAEIVSVLLF